MGRPEPQVQYTKKKLSFDSTQTKRDMILSSEKSQCNEPRCSEQVLKAVAKTLQRPATYVFKLFPCHVSQMYRQIAQLERANVLVVRACKLDYNLL